MTTYRAAYINDVVLTGPEHARLDDKALMAEAIAEAERTGLIGDDEHQIRADEAADRITIGDWRA